MPLRTTRRRFLAASGAALAAAHSGCSHVFSPGSKGRPLLSKGVASGDITAHSAIVWSASDRAGRMAVDWDTSDSFKNFSRVIGPDAVSRNGFTARIDLQELPPDTRIFYRVTFENLDDFSLSAPALGSFKTAPHLRDDHPRDITFAWSGDTAGQGWGIDPARGGMPVYKALADLQPDFFIHSGDTIYADIPILPEIKLRDGTVWKSIVTPAKSKPAESLDDFRQNHAYNLLDENVRRFNSLVPIIAQWDDHETHNNWYPGQVLTDPAYTERNLDVLSDRARQAFLEYQPIRISSEDTHRIYRSYAHGPLLEVFMLDERSYRGKNSPNRQETLDRDAYFLAPLQLEWLKSALKKSTAVWKVIASDMPISCNVKDGKTDYEAWANGENGRPLGRELELANLLSFIKSNQIKNTVWITADVHFPANIHYHPDRAAFKEFDPFWEFISGPLHAGGFGPSTLDMTFGPQYAFKRPPEKSGDGPGHGFAAFGVIRIDAESKRMSVSQHDIAGRPMVTQEIEPSL